RPARADYAGPRQDAGLHHGRRPLHPQLDPPARLAGGGRVRADHAVVRRSDRGGRPAEDHRIHPLDRPEGDGGDRTMTPPRGDDYLDASYPLKSWLLTTDHKRIGLLYLVSITFFFFIGGAAATVMRLELMPPAGDALASPDPYNRLFTMHGVVMIFF